MVESQNLNSEQITDTVKLDSSANVVEILTDDYDTFASKEAKIQIKVDSKT